MIGRILHIINVYVPFSNVVYFLSNVIKTSSINFVTFIIDVETVSISVLIKYPLLRRETVNLKIFRRIGRNFCVVNEFDELSSLDT